MNNKPTPEEKVKLRPEDYLTSQAYDITENGKTYEVVELFEAIYAVKEARRLACKEGEERIAELEAKLQSCEGSRDYYIRQLSKVVMEGEEKLKEIRKEIGEYVGVVNDEYDRGYNNAIEAALRIVNKKLIK